MPDEVERARRGYDAIVQSYLAWAQPSPTRARYIAALRQRLPLQLRILEIGYGAGLSVARDLVEYAEVVGVDVSAAQIALARQVSLEGLLGRKKGERGISWPRCCWFRDSFAEA